MTRQQSICYKLMNTGQKNRIICDAFCSRVKQNNCPVLQDIAEIERQEQEFKFDETRELTREEIQI